MKIAIFLIVVLAGAVMAEDCKQFARDNCSKAFDNYNPNFRHTYCNHVRSVERCLKYVHVGCYKHYYDEYETQCGMHMQMKKR